MLNYKTASLIPSTAVDPHPLMEHEDCKLLISLLEPSKIMLEWGAGYSTLCFAKYVRAYYSIEHTAEWADQLTPRLLPNTQLFYVPRTAPPPIDENYPYDSYEQYKDYIETAGKISNEIKSKFDYVLIDGRARIFCARYILPYIHEDTLIFVHDFYPNMDDNRDDCNKAFAHCRGMLLEYEELSYDTKKSMRVLAVLRRRRHFHKA